MAQYKVIQDIEAEDKLLGPLSLRQFIYAGGAALLGYLSFIAIAKGAAFLLIIFVPPMVFCAFFAWPWSPDQPTEVWALARIRFYFKPRRRIWDQSGVKELVTITAPPKVEKVYTNGLSQTEVKSRLSALADTIDSRGWAIKNANVNMPTLPAFDMASSDRLLTSATPQAVSDIDVTASDDIMDEQNNPIAHQFDTMIQQATETHRQQVLERMRSVDAPISQPVAPAPTAQGQPTPDYWFLHQPTDQAAPAMANSVVFANPQIVQPGAQPVGPVAAIPTPSEEALGQQLLQQNTAKQHLQNMHLPTINPLGQADAMSAPATGPTDPSVASPAAATPPMTPPTDAAILNLANNNDLDVATLARQAQKATHPGTDEVVISLR